MPVIPSPTIARAALRRIRESPVAAYGEEEANRPLWYSFGMQPGHEGGSPRSSGRGRRRGRVAAAAAAVAALSLLAAGCGGGSSSGVAALGATTATTPATSAPSAPSSTSPLLTKLVHFAACMRSHGVGNFPDPTSRGGGVRLAIGPGSGIDPQAASFQRAQKACASLLPTRGEIAAQLAKEIQQRLPGMLSFSRCMRRRGVAGFPDPSAEQGLTLQMVQAAGVDVRSQRVIAAAQACLPAADGAITAAQLKQVEQRAASGGNGP